MDYQNQVCGYLGFHMTFSLQRAGLEYDHSIARLRKQFRFGSWAEAQKETITYCGCEISQSASFDSHVRQERFALSIDEIDLSHDRKHMVHELVTNQERRLMRQALGALNWEINTECTMDVSDYLTPPRMCRVGHGR